ncbi:hypothetical protein [Sphingobacterium sp. LRF_L2]|uniref:hypothetical protein n=1 Tax=Sphingobacterium sp. LRF_L2 TaxID=3369421 RepID=UPI003F5E803B
MRKISAKIVLLGLLSVLTFGTILTSCSSSDDNTEEINQELNHYKITVTLNNVDPDRDFVSVTVVGGNINGKTDVWKLNGVAQTGESAVGLDKNDFAGTTKTYVIETTEPIRLFTGGVQIINYGDPMPLSFKIEKGSETIINENLTLTGDGADFTKQYSF